MSPPAQASVLVNAAAFNGSFFFLFGPRFLNALSIRASDRSRGAPPPRRLPSSLGRSPGRSVARSSEDMAMAMSSSGGRTSDARTNQLDQDDATWAASPVQSFFARFLFSSRVACESGRQRRKTTRANLRRTRHTAHGNTHPMRLALKSSAQRLCSGNTASRMSGRWYELARWPCAMAPAARRDRRPRSMGAWCSLT